MGYYSFDLQDEEGNTVYKHGANDGPNGEFQRSLGNEVWFQNILKDPWDLFLGGRRADKAFQAAVCSVDPETGQELFVKMFYRDPEMIYKSLLNELLSHRETLGWGDETLNHQQLDSVMMLILSCPKGEKLFRQIQDVARYVEPDGF